MVRVAQAETTAPAAIPAATAQSGSQSGPLSDVRDPEQTLTNLTVYSRGRDVGHIRSVEVGQAGLPQRVEIAFNDGASAAWVSADALRYDGEHRLATTTLDPGEMKALEHTRLR